MLFSDVTRQVFGRIAISLGSSNQSQVQQVTIYSFSTPSLQGANMSDLTGNKEDNFFLIFINALKNTRLTNLIRVEIALIYKSFE